MWASITLFFLAFANVSSYTDSRYDYKPEVTPYYLVSGSGSYEGWMTAGVGVNIVPIYASELSIGHTPKDFGGNINQINWKHIFGYRYGKIKPYGFFKTMITDNKDTFILLPEQYPAKYYPPTGMYSSVGVGVEYHIFSNLTAYVEVATLDYYMEVYVRSPNYFEPHDIGTYGIGFKRNIDW